MAEEEREHTPIPNPEATVDYYVAEWENEGSCGWIARRLAERVNITVPDALLFLNWLERLAHNNVLRANEKSLEEWREGEMLWRKSTADFSARQRAFLELAEKHMKDDHGEEPWKDGA